MWNCCGLTHQDRKRLQTRAVHAFTQRIRYQVEAIAIRNKKLLGAPGLTTSNKKASRLKAIGGHCY